MTQKAKGVLFGVLVALVLTAAPARASFHLIKIVEVFPGTASEPTAQYVMLQMYFPGQTFVGGHTVSVFDATGMNLGTFTFSGDVANGADLATILIASTDAEALFGLHADLEMMPLIQTAGGAVCYDIIDCVAWGNFSGAAMLPVPPDPTFNPTTGLVLGMAMHRDLMMGGATTDFALAPPAPKNNAGQAGMLTQTPNPEATETPTATVSGETPTATPMAGACVGDCDGNHKVAVNEILILVNIVLGTQSASACPSGDLPAGPVTVTTIVEAVHNVLDGCP